MDTSATFSKIPRSVAERLELGARYEAEVELGDWRIVKRELTLAEIEMGTVRHLLMILMSITATMYDIISRNTAYAAATGNLPAVISINILIVMVSQPGL